MENVNILKLNDSGYPAILKDIPYPPKQLFWTGANPSEWIDRPKVAIVGSRKISAYGRTVTSQLAGQLARAGVVIISGLAYGVDTVAHEAAVAADGCAVVVLATSLERIYPAVNGNLARRIVDTGGTIMTECANGENVYRSSFVARNRTVSGLADVLLITEASLKSGSLHTARFALDQGKTVMVVPGNITSPGSEGCNNLIKSGAIPVTNVDDIFFALKIKPSKTRAANSFHGRPEEEKIVQLIQQGIDSQEEMALVSQLDGASINSTLTMLEIAGVIRPEGGGRWMVV